MRATTKTAVVVLVALAACAVSHPHPDADAGYPAPIHSSYGVPKPTYGTPPHRPSGGGKGKGKGGGFFSFDIFKGFKDLFSFKGKGNKGGGGGGYGPPPRPNYGPPPPTYGPPKPSYGPPPRPSKGKAPKGNYGPPPPAPAPTYGAPIPAPAPTYGVPVGIVFPSAPVPAPAPTYGAPPVAPAPTYGAPVAPAPTYGAPVAHANPAPTYGAPPVAPAPTYGAPPVAPAPTYGAPVAATAPAANYGAPKPTDIIAQPTGTYGPPPPAAPASDYGAPPPPAASVPAPGYGAPPPPADPVPAPAPGYGAPPPPAHPVPAPGPGYGAPPPPPAFDPVPAPAAGYGPPKAPTIVAPAEPAPVYGTPIAPVPAPVQAPVNDIIYIAPGPAPAPAPVPAPAPLYTAAPAPATLDIDIRGPDVPAAPQGPPTEPDCELCDKNPWVPVEGYIAPGPDPRIPDPVPAVTAAPAPITTLPPAPEPRIPDPVPAVTAPPAPITTLPPAPETSLPEIILETTAPPASIVTEAPAPLPLDEAPAPAPIDLEVAALLSETETAAPEVNIGQDIPETLVRVHEPAREPKMMDPEVLTTINSIVEPASTIFIIDDNVVTEIADDVVTVPAIVEPTITIVEEVETEVPIEIYEPILVTDGPVEAAPLDPTYAPIDIEPEITDAPVINIAPVVSVDVRANDPIVLTVPNDLTDNEVQEVLDIIAPEMSIVKGNLEIVDAGQPVLIDTSVGEAIESMLQALSDPTLVGVSDPVQTISEPQFLSVSQPDIPQTSQVTTLTDSSIDSQQNQQQQQQPLSFEPSINIADINTAMNIIPSPNLATSGPDINIQDFRFENIGNSVLVDTSTGNAGDPQTISVGSPEVISVSKPEIVSVSRPQFVSVEQPELKQTSEFLPEVNQIIATIAPVSSTGGVSILDTGAPQFLSASQGNVGNSQVVSISDPLLQNVGQVQIIRVTQPIVGNVEQPSYQPPVQLRPIPARNENIAGSVESAGTPIFVSQSQGSAVNSGVVGVSQPQVHNIGQAQPLSVSEPVINSVEQPSQPTITKGTQLSATFGTFSLASNNQHQSNNIGIPLSATQTQGFADNSIIQPQSFPLSSTFSSSFSSISSDIGNSISSESVGIPLSPVQSQGSAGDSRPTITQGVPLSANLGTFSLASNGQFQSNDVGSSISSVGIPLSAVQSQGPAGSSFVVDVSQPQVQNIGLAQTFSVSEPVVNNVVQPSQSTITQGVPLSANFGTFSLDSNNQFQSNNVGSSVSSVGVPLSTTQSQGSAGSSFVVDVSQPQVQNIGQPQTLSVSEPVVNNVAQPSQSSITQGVPLSGNFETFSLENNNLDSSVVSAGIPFSSHQSLSSPQAQSGARAESSGAVIAAGVPLFVQQGNFQLSQPQTNQFQPEQQFLSFEGNNDASITQGHPISSTFGSFSLAKPNDASSSVQLGSPSFVSSSQGNTGASQFVSISNPVVQSEGQSQLSFNQFQQQNNEQFQSSSFSSQNDLQQSSEGESVFVSQSLGEPSNTGFVSQSEPTFVSVSQPELLLSSFSSSPNQDVGGVSLLPTIPKVETADMSTLPLGDSSSLSSSFPPFPNDNQRQQQEQQSIQQGVLIQEAIAPSSIQAQFPPVNAYIPPSGQQTSENGRQISNQQSFNSANTAKSLEGNTQSNNALISNPEIIINNNQLNPLVIDNLKQSNTAFRTIPNSIVESSVSNNIPSTASNSISSQSQLTNNAKTSLKNTQTPTTIHTQSSSSDNLDNTQTPTSINVRNKVTQKNSSTTRIPSRKRNFRPLRRGNGDGGVNYSSPGQRVSIVFGRRLNPGRLSNRFSSSSSSSNSCSGSECEVIRPTRGATRSLQQGAVANLIASRNSAKSVKKIDSKTTKELEDTTETSITIDSINDGISTSTTPNPTTTTTIKSLRRFRPIPTTTNPSLTSITTTVTPRTRLRLLPRRPIRYQSKVRNQGASKNSDNKKSKNINLNDNANEEVVIELDKNINENQDQVSQKDNSKATTENTSDQKDDQVSDNGGGRSLSNGGSAFRQLLPQRAFGTRHQRRQSFTGSFTNTSGPNQLLTSQSVPDISNTNKPKATIFTNNIRNNKNSALNNISNNNIHSAATNPFRKNNIAKVTTTNIARNNGTSSPSTNLIRNNNTTKDITNSNVNRNKQLPSLSSRNTIAVASTEIPVVATINNINPLQPRPNLNPKINRLFPSRQLINMINQKESSSSSSNSSSSSSNNSKTLSNVNSGSVNTWHDLILRSQSQQQQQNSSFNQEKHFVKSFTQFPSKTFPKAPLSTFTTSLSPRNNNQIGNLVRPSPITTSLNFSKGRQLIPQITRPVPNSAAVLRRPFTPITRPISRVVQTQASDDYIKSFPEVAAPEGFPEGVKDPEEDTIRKNIIELQRIN